MAKYDIVEEEVRCMYCDELMDVKDIAARYGCSAPNIRRILKKRKWLRGKTFINEGKSQVWNRGLTKADDDRLQGISDRMTTDNPMQGATPWNNGLTKENDQRLKSVSDKLSGREKSDDHRKSLSDAKIGLTGDQTNNWQGGKSYISHLGYLVNRFTRDGVRWYEHRWVAYNAIGRDFRESEEVHHVDRIRTNNDPSNLIVLMAGDHTRLHRAISRGINTKAEQIQWLQEHEIEFEVCDAENLKDYAA